MRDFENELKDHCMQGLRLVPATNASRSYLGGDPKLEPDTPWPVNNGHPLRFLARISLSEVDAGLRFRFTRSSGALLFFCDDECLPGGWDPKDSDAFAVLSVPDLLEPVMVEGHARSVDLVPFATYPSWEHPAVTALDLDRQESDEYYDFVDGVFGRDEPRHQLGGHPSPVQGEGMELLCQLASSGHYCGSSWSGLKDILPQMRLAAPRWKLLLQIDSDSALNFEWLDGGRLYFWAPVDESGGFILEDVWLATQCC